MEILTIAQDDNQNAIQFVKDVFLDCDSLGYSEEGKQSFLSFLDDHGQELIYIGLFDTKLIGVIGFRKDTYHIALFFVEKQRQNQGLGRLLFDQFKEVARRNHIARITANAAKQSIDIYRALGFDATDEILTVGGIVYQPMEYLMEEEVLGKEVTVTIDRPYGSFHPHYPDTYYECNYGYIDEMVGGDEDFQDAYVIGPKEPLESFKGIVIGIIYRRDDIETKWIVAKDDHYDKEEVINAIGSVEQYFDTRIVWKEK